MNAALTATRLTGHLHINRAAESAAFIPPDFTKDFRAGKSRSGALNQVTQELKFPGGQTDRSAVSGYLRAAKVNGNGPEFIKAGAASGGVAAQQDLDAGHEFHGVKRFRDIVIRPEL